MWGGGDTDGQHDTSGRPSWVSHFPANLTTGYKGLDKTRYFSQNYFMTGKDDKAVFSIPSDTFVFHHTLNGRGGIVGDIKDGLTK
jgi:hypothetical protein